MSDFDGRMLLCVILVHILISYYSYIANIRPYFDFKPGTQVLYQ